MIKAGQQFGRHFQIRGLLGEGGMGQKSRALDRAPGGEVAVGEAGDRPT